MSTSIQGVDSHTRVTSDVLVKDATTLLGNKPSFWGRYFSGATYEGDGEYFHSKENNTLRCHDIRVLPIGRYTTRVGGHQQDGEQDGREQADDFIVTFGKEYLKAQGGEFYFFLDVEPENPLSVAYYIGWSKAVGAISSEVKLLPCVYLNAGDSISPDALNEAIAQGAECHGLWIARYDDRYQQKECSKPDFKEGKVECHSPIKAPVLLWQYAGEIGQGNEFDLNLSNPELGIDQQTFLKRLVLPQAV